MEIIVTLLIISPLILFTGWLAFGRFKVDLPIAVGAIFIGLASVMVYMIGKSGKTTDYEVWNGQVTGKSVERVSCEHSYACNCRPVTTCSGSGKDRTCTTSVQCDTCYEHSFDYDWILYTNLAHGIRISRVDRQGKVEPPRYTTAKSGDPVAEVHTFTNYVKAVDESIFNPDKGIGSLEAYMNSVPGYPISIYDYHYISRFIPVGFAAPADEVKRWNLDIANMLKTLGPTKQANVIIMPVKTADPNFFYAVQKKWLNGKKNDIVVMLGVDEYPKISWVKVMSWTDRKLFITTLEDDIEQIGTLDREKIISAIQSDTVKYFERKRMRDFQYLESEIRPEPWVVVFAFLIDIIGSVLLLQFMRRKFPFHNRY
jgi:hypothetical protein